MSVYKPETKPFYLYDFVIQGRRFHGSTGQKVRRAAEAFEDRLRREIGEGKHGQAAQLTLDEAAGKWWSEHGSKMAYASWVWPRVELLLQFMGPKTRLAEITTAHVSEAMQKRMGLAYRKSPAEDAQAYLPKNATVNRDVIGTLRPILNRAVTHWGATGLNHIRWNDIKLPIPRTQVRTYSAAEQAAWMAECGPAAGLFLDMLLTYGPRFGELFFPLDAFDPDGPRLRIAKRKRDVPLVLPILDRHATEIRARLGRARAAELETIWFVEVPSKIEGEPAELETITYFGMQARLKSAAKRAGVKPGRLLHSTRHHAGTAILRSTGNLKLTQEMLGHADIKSTLVYVHTLEQDLRSALEGRQTAAPAASAKKDRRRSK